MKEASEVPNFLEEVNECRKICSSDAATGPRGEKPEHDVSVFKVDVSSAMCNVIIIQF